MFQSFSNSARRAVDIAREAERLTGDELWRVLRRQAEVLPKTMVILSEADLERASSWE